MSSISEDHRAELRRQLEHAVIGCADRGLYQSSKWAAELLNSLPSSDIDSGSETDPDSPIASGRARRPFSKSPSIDPHEASLEAQEHHKFLLAKSFFDCREYDRCAAVFLPSTLPRIPASAATPSPAKSKVSITGKEKITSPPRPNPLSLSLSHVSQKALFLAIYAKYLAGEKRKDEDSEMILGPADGGVTLNKELTPLIGLLGEWFQEREVKGRNGGGWLEYLYGIILAKNKSEDLAKTWFLKSVHLYPFNWGSWQELSNLVTNVEELGVLSQSLPQHVMAFVFHVYSNQELYQTDHQVHAALDGIQRLFPNSAFLKSQRALLFLHSKDYDESESIFSSLLQSDPYRLDALDQYSNVLYVIGHRPKLAFLAQLAAQTDKFRPETCCIVGNYYSRNSEHEKAVMYFRRALTLDRNYLSAWTLMGHEYVEMKNTHAALESYRRAVDVNRKDYRAWHGLGLTYEMLEMHSYALFYHQRAAALRPYDPKTWQAVGACFARIGKTENAIRAYKRALVAGTYYEAAGGSSFGSAGDSIHALGGGILDPESLYQIALLYERVDEVKECAAYMELVLAQEEGNGRGSSGGGDDMGGLMGSQSNVGNGVGVTPTTSKARMWLAKWEFESSNYQRANELANELCQDGVEVEDAKALIRDIRSRIDNERERGG